jgi:hypothetical protein
MPTAIASSLVHIIFIPSVHFSIFMVQRGIIIMFMAGMAIIPGAPPIIVPGMFIRSIVIMVFIVFAFLLFCQLIGQAFRLPFPVTTTGYGPQRGELLGQGGFRRAAFTHSNLNPNSWVR